MFSVDNAGLVFSATVLAIALILAGLMMVMGNRGSAEEMPDQLRRNSSMPSATVEPSPTDTANPSDTEVEVDLPEEKAAAGAGSSGAVSVSFTVVSSRQRTGDEE